MKNDIIIKGLGKHVVPKKYMIIPCTSRAVKEINAYFSSYVKKNIPYIASYEYYGELKTLIELFHFNYTFERPDFDESAFY